MASEVEIVNAALTLLGESRIISLDDDTKAAREAKALFTINRNALLASYSWSFAKAIKNLTQDGTNPGFGFSYRYMMPVTALHVIRVGDKFAGLDLTDYRGASTAEFNIFGRYIHTNLGAPLKFEYVDTVTDTGQFAAAFVKAFACYMAMDLAEPLTQSDSKRERAERAYQRAINLAIRANAIELPPQKLADDEWINARL